MICGGCYGLCCGLLVNKFPNVLIPVDFLVFLL